MNTKGLLGYILAVIIALLWACGLQCNEQAKPETERIVQSRNQDLKQEKVLEAKTDTFIRDRWRTKTKYDTIIKEVVKQDSATINAYFDSFVQNKKNAVVLFYQYKSCSTELVLMDSVHYTDSVRISLLRASNLKADTLLVESDARAKKRFWAGFKIGFGTGYAAGIGTSAIVK